MKSSRSAPCSRARSTSRFSSGRICAAALGDEAAAARLAQERRPQRQVPGLELEHPLEEGGQPVPGVLGGRRLLGKRDDLADVLGVDRLDERLARGEVTVERADADPGTARDLLECAVGAVLGEDFAAGLDEERLCF